ncbi:MAG TPA: hypothetical protein VNM47_11965 [Terriglobia bacterium]|nr:hypothetical protein [Terriglobia bacterium]
MWGKITFTSKAVLLGMALALCLGLTQVGSALPGAAQDAKAKKTVYVCACAGTKSCPCMAMSKKEGKCPCGTDTMKEVPADGAWAKANRKALSE